ncbi:MAG: branched-chain amino acid ABC transporter permease [archaeon]|nr:branched-chain amino acid ABC transporter permease [archaeon]
MIDLGLELIQTILQGLVYGGIYALATLGMSIVFSVIGVLNLAHGDFIMLGGFVGLLVSEIISPNTFGIFAVLLIFLVAFVLIGALGGAYEFALIRPTLKRSYEQILISSILITVGTAFIIENLGYQIMPAYIIGRQTTFTIPIVSSKFALNIDGVPLSGISLIALLAVAFATVSLYIFSTRTYVGKAMRAISQNSESARLMGVNLQRISILTFALGSGFGAIAGVSIGMTSTLSPGFGLPYTISLLSVMVLGGTKSYWGALVGGLIIGFVQVLFGSPYFNPLTILPGIQINGLYFWAPAVALFILIIVLMIKPTGLSGRRSTSRV